MALLNSGGAIAQFQRNDRSIPPVEVISRSGVRNDTANQRMALLTLQMKELQGVNEALKARDQMAWVGAMNNIRNAAEEIVLNELIYN